MIAAACGAAACGGSKVPHPPMVGQPTSALMEVPYPPPPARGEYVPDKPKSGAVWIDGEWTWKGRRWSWRHGRWVMVPPGAKYSPWTAIRNGDGTLYVAPGVWRDAKGNAIDDPPMLARGRAQPGAVVNPEGETEETGPNDAENRQGKTDGGAGVAPLPEPEHAPARGPLPDAGEGAPTTTGTSAKDGGA